MVDAFFIEDVEECNAQYYYDLKLWFSDLIFMLIRLILELAHSYHLHCIISECPVTLM